MRLLTRKQFIALSTASLFILSSAWSTGSAAADLRIGLAADVTSFDPHYINSGPNNSFAFHVFDALVNVDANGNLVPGLATSWKAIDPLTWEFKLRRGVKFHDGSELTSADVIFSLDRPATLLNSPGPYTSYTKQIVAKQAVDAYTLRLKTATPYGPLPLDVNSIFIVSKKIAQHASTDDFNSGKAMVGTGPFKFSKAKRGESIELIRNDQYWGDKPAWNKVTFRILTSGAPRIAALLAGDVDAIDGVPPADLPKLKTNSKVKLEQKISWRTIFWHLDQQAHVSPYIIDKAGKPLPNNPFLDIRVRKAISKAINRQALSDRILEGLAVPASNIVAPGILGYDDSLKIEAYDPEGAKKLLADAGYPNGFALTLHGPNNRYINDEQVVQTVAQFLSKIGIQTKVETLPMTVYLPKAAKSEFSMSLLGWGTLAGDFALRTVAGTVNPETGWGSWNWGKYSNPALDDLVRNSLASVDDAKRRDFAKKAMGLALRDYAVVPLHHQYATWALRKDLKYTARTDEFTFAQDFRPE
ncbi:ABC transporter substrate-binding protein [Undibacterium sp. Jales W-56]|uniref:ABC transporter substrate-binding protein n=1 Tax=Undibacterium sp. Jales W-56 TaxID=2897325 RepID=UPI0021D0C337|nr:ABC transporter substrate-binding protein [Undibacterium sp. Jales W-56]MCU6435843.1 ABC transporter substrate-binding protein [Undibacterium sp. Jales W-56]